MHVPYIHFVYEHIYEGALAWGDDMLPLVNSRADETSAYNPNRTPM